MMKMPEDLAIRLQFNLYLISIDSYCPDIFVCAQRSTNTTNAEKMSAWQFSVDIIYKCLKSGILGIWSGAWMRARHIEDTLAFCDALAQHNPFDEKDFSESGSTFWLEPLLFASNECINLVSKYNISKIEDTRLCHPFISEVENFFEAAGVPWTHTPSIPIASTFPENFR